MGDAKRKKERRTAFFAEHPNCIYCGGVATTEDHCPARCLFKAKHAPEKYIFPSCDPCNQQAKGDEQIMAVLTRIRLSDSNGLYRDKEWSKYLRAVRSNYPEVFEEWTPNTPARNKREMRKMLGAEGDVLRLQGWGVVEVGPLTTAAIERFYIKLAKALYYLHNKRVFDGIIYAYDANNLMDFGAKDAIKTAVDLAPMIAEVSRSRVSLSDQFHYRFNHNVEHGAFYGFVTFSEQFRFILICLDSKMAESFDTQVKESGQQPFTFGRFDCRLNKKS